MHLQSKVFQYSNNLDSRFGLRVIIETLFMNSRTVCLILLAASFSWVPAVAKMKVQSQHQKGNDCRRYKTYQWLPTNTIRKIGIIENDEKSTPAIRAAVDRQLKAKGLKEVASNGDLQVATAVMRETSPHTDALIYAWFPDYYTGTYWSTGSPTVTLTSFSNIGTFVVNLIDAQTKKSAWVALARDTVDNDKMAAEKLEKAATKMFEDFPPKKP